MTEIVLGATTFISVLVAIYYNCQYSIHRWQVIRLQAQVRAYRDAGREGRIMVPTIEGLWPDLDEKERLRERVRELEAE